MTVRIAHEPARYVQPGSREITLWGPPDEVEQWINLNAPDWTWQARPVPYQGGVLVKVRTPDPDWWPVSRRTRGAGFVAAFGGLVLVGAAGLTLGRTAPAQDAWMVLLPAALIGIAVIAATVVAERLRRRPATRRTRAASTRRAVQPTTHLAAQQGA